MYKDLRQFVDALEAAGELVRVRAPVSPLCEITEIVDRVSKRSAPNGPSARTRSSDPANAERGGPALLFENVEGSDIPLLINAYGSYRRMEIALGATEASSRWPGGPGLDGVAELIGELTKPQPPRGLSEAFGKAMQFAPLLKIGPKRGGKAVCQEIVETGDAIDLTHLPILRCWPLDGDFKGVGYPAGLNDGVAGLGHPAIKSEDWESAHRGRYITLAGIHTIHADDADDPKPASHNIGMYRVQLLGKDRLAMHWHVHHDGARHWRSWKRRGEDMPVAIALGGEAILPYAATAPLPPGISELLMAGFLNGAGIRLTRAKTVPLWVPANAEIVIEGFVSHEAGEIGWDPRESNEPLGSGAVFEGPFGDHTGFYSMPDRYPLLRVTAVTRRRNAIYPTTVVGLPPQEDYYLGKATERLFLPLLKVLIPDVEDYDLPMFGAFHNCAFIKIKKSYPMQARRVMHAIWGAGQMAWTKTIFVVDEDVNIHDHEAVLRAAAMNCRPDRDIERANGPLDILDHAAPALGAGMKLGFDCTRRWPGEEAGSSAPIEPRVFEPFGEFLEQARGLSGVIGAAAPDSLGGWAFIALNKTEPGQGREVAEQLASLNGMARPPYVVVTGAVSGPEDWNTGLFHWLANTDASRDAVAIAGDRPMLVFDATPKSAGDEANGRAVRAWPPIIAMDDATRALVDRRWPEYGIPT
ncbi:MAG: UbiD family decarboxylase [Planctomycetota bacterium]